MISLSSLASLILLLMSVPIFLVFGIGAGIPAVYSLDLPWTTLIRVAFASVTKNVLIAGMRWKELLAR